MDLMNPFDVAQTVGVTALLLIAVVAVNRFVALTKSARKNKDRKEKHEGDLPELREADDPSPLDR